MHISYSLSSAFRTRTLSLCQGRRIITAKYLSLLAIALLFSFVPSPYSRTLSCVRMEKFHDRVAMRIPHVSASFTINRLFYGNQMFWFSKIELHASKYVIPCNIQKWFSLSFLLCGQRISHFTAFFDFFYLFSSPFFCFLVLYVLSFGTCFFGSNLLFFCNARFFVNFSSFFLCFDTSATSVFFPETLARRSGYRKIPSQSASLQFYCLPFSVSSYMFFHLLLVRWICHQLLVAILNRKFQGVNIELPLAGNYHRLAEVNCLELHAYILFFILFFLEIFAYGWQFHRKCLTHLSAILLSWE